MECSHVCPAYMLSWTVFSGLTRCLACSWPRVAMSDAWTWLSPHMRSTPSACWGGPVPNSTCAFWGSMQATAICTSTHTGKHMILMRLICAWLHESNTMCGVAPCQLSSCQEHIYREEYRCVPAQLGWSCRLQQEPKCGTNQGRQIVLAAEPHMGAENAMATCILVRQTRYAVMTEMFWRRTILMVMMIKTTADNSNSNKLQ